MVLFSDSSHVNDYTPYPRRVRVEVDRERLGDMYRDRLKKENKMRNLKLLILVILALTCTGCVSLARIDGPYEGRVIDADTKEPVEGAVVHGNWYKVWGTVGGASSEWYDSAETLTDKNGEFRLPGKGLLLLTNIEEIDLTIFKAGYEQLIPRTWESIRISKRGNIVWEGNKPTFRLKHLSMEARQKRLVDMPSSPSNRHRKLFIRELNKENMQIGSSLATIFSEE